MKKYRYHTFGGQPSILFIGPDLHFLHGFVFFAAEPQQSPARSTSRALLYPSRLIASEPQSQPHANTAANERRRFSC